MLNKKNSISTFLLYPKPMIETIKLMDQLKSTSVNIHTFNSFVKDAIYHYNKNSETKTGNIIVSKKDIDNISMAYSIDNMLSNGLIGKNDNNNTIYFPNKYLLDMFRDIFSSQKYGMSQNLKIGLDFQDYLTKLKDLHKKLKNKQFLSLTDQEEIFYHCEKILDSVRCDLDNNFKNIKDISENISQHNENESIKNKILLIENINKLNNKNIEPFKNFLSQDSGVINILTKIRKELDGNDQLQQVREINLYIITINSYYQSLIKIYEKINAYIRKNKDDIELYQAFEKAFNKVKDVVDDINDGRLINYTLESNNLLDNFNFKELYNIKNTKINKKNINIDYSKIILRFNHICESVEEHIQKEEIKKEEKKKKFDSSHIKNIENKNKQDNDKSYEKYLIRSKFRNVINNNINILKEKDLNIDLVTKIDNLLKENVENYYSGYVLEALQLVEKNFDKLNIKTKIAFNERKSINLENRGTYIYIPEYCLGE